MVTTALPRVYPPCADCGHIHGVHLAVSKGATKYRSPCSSGHGPRGVRCPCKAYRAGSALDGGHVWQPAPPGGLDQCRCGILRFAYYAHAESRRPCPSADAAA